MSLQEDIDYLGLTQCNFNDECDHCHRPTGNFSYAKLLSFEEADFYICEKCIPVLADRQRKEDQRREEYHKKSITGQYPLDG
jgi:protein-arginine kinase activator protein McsA